MVYQDESKRRRGYQYRRFLKRKGGYSGGPFTPLSLPGLVGFWRADQGITQASGAVSAWATKAATAIPYLRSAPQFQPGTQQL
jgi:hypothetical protein